MSDIKPTEIYVEFNDKETKNRAINEFVGILGSISVDFRHNNHVWFKPYDGKSHYNFINWLEKQGVEYESA